MSDGDALLAAVLKHYDDNTPRLVYADWLQEHGDDARAELIRLQCAGRSSEELIAANPHWTRLPCPTCEGTGWHKPHSLFILCNTCDGAEDLLMTARTHVHDETVLERREVHFSRGFIHRISMCKRELAHAMRPTALARALYDGLPFLRRIKLTDVSAEREEGGWEFYDLPDFLHVKGTYETESQADEAAEIAAYSWLKVHACESVR